MTREEFINICVVSGYAPRKFATVYAEGKKELTEDDYIEVHRRYQCNCDIKERASDTAYGRRDYQGVTSTKKFGLRDGTRDW